MEVHIPHVPPLVVVLAVAVLAPLLGELTRRIGLSVVVLELLLGVAIGPNGLGWAAPEGGVPYFAIMGLAFLFFIAGLEIDLEAISGKPLNFAIFGWLIVFALSCAAAIGLRAAGLVDAWLIVAIALSTTALGVLVPILRDSGALEQPFGRYVMAAGAVGELGPILVMSLALSKQHTVTGQTAFTMLFIAIVLVAAWLLVQGGSMPRVLGILRRTMTQSSQLPVRTIMLVVTALGLLAHVLGLDLVLGALAAGMIIRLATRGLDAHVLHAKIDAIGFGFLVPVFIVTAGMRLDVNAIFGSTAGLALMVLFFVALPLVRVPLALLCAGQLGA
ncbi:MAG TPA: cation:proton antiporter, partial [Burkholderiales bacterium]|nr:cation:proton antiporter [Burkholderiales bacterium]